MNVNSLCVPFNVIFIQFFSSTSLIITNILFPSVVSQSFHCILAFMLCGRLHSRSDFFILHLLFFIEIIPYLPP